MRLLGLWRVAATKWPDAFRLLGAATTRRASYMSDLPAALDRLLTMAGAWLETLPNRPHRLQRDESGAEADEDLDDGEGAA